MRVFDRRSAASSALRARVRPLWPEAGRLRVTRSPRGRGPAERDFLVLPTMRVPILLVPADVPAAAPAMARFGVGQQARQATRLMAWLHARGLLRWTPLARVRVAQGDDTPVLQAVRGAVPGTAGLVVWLGRYRPGRAVVVNSFGADGGSLAYAKCAWGEFRGRIRQEHDTLVDVALRPVAGIRAPRVLAFEEHDDHTLLVLEALDDARRSTGAPAPPVAAMRALAERHGWQETTVAASPVVHTLRQDITALAEPAAREWLRAELERLVTDLGHVRTRSGAWHGDWVAWNMIDDPSGLRLWDWEHYHHGVPAGWDHLHYLAQELRRTTGTSAAVEDRWLSEARQVLKADWQVDGDEAEAAIRGYLLWINVRYVADREGEPQAAVRRGWSRELLGRLGRRAEEGPTGPGHLRILHVSEVHWGGVLTLLRHFVAEQAAAGHEVHVLGPEELFAGAEPLDGRVTPHHWTVRRGNPLTLARAVRQLRRLVAELEPDVVHLHSFFAGMLGRLPGGLSGLAGVPVVYQPHAWSDRLSPRASAAALVRAIERRGSRRTTLLVANCTDELLRGQEFGVRTPGRPIGVTVDLELFRPPTDEERSRARATLGLDGRRVALVLGRLARQKGQDLLLPEWERSRPDDTVLALVGPGDLDFVIGPAGREWGRSVIAPGGTDDVRPWLWAADVLVLSSRYETVALVVAEAMATGLPVVATAVDGVREVLLEGEEPAAGAVVPLDDMAGLVRELTRRLDDPDLRRAEAAAGPLRARTRFAPSAVAGKLEAAYREAITTFGRDPR